MAWEYIFILSELFLSTVYLTEFKLVNYLI